MKPGPIEVKRRGRILLFPGADLSVALPFGVGVTTDNSSFELKKTAAGYVISASRRDNPSIRTQISPTYSAVESLRSRGGERPTRIRFWVVQSDLDRLRARQLIEQEHYLMPTARGMFLACSFEEKEKGRRPRIVGVGVLDALYHGNPKQGRALFATEALGTGRWRDWPRDKIVNRLRISWASRFAVDSKYQGRGIGTRL